VWYFCVALVEHEILNVH